jgi:poly(A) polymerase/tRNA nucleotidyltransferase (CCA-adding enzyme)
MHSLQHAANKDLTLAERLAALLHDIGKPRSRRKKGSGYTFYGHEVIGARMVREIMKNLHFSKDTSEAVEKLVRWHMFFSDPDQISLSAVRRMIVNVGKDRIQYLLNIRMCDRIGSGRPKEQPFRLRKYTAMVDEAMRDPISVNMLKVDGNMLINELHEKPGPRIGWILHALLEDVLDDTAKNTKEYLINKAKDLIKLNNAKLQQLGKSGAEKRMEVDEVEIAKLHAKHKI